MQCLWPNKNCRSHRLRHMQNLSGLRSLHTLFRSSSRWGTMLRRRRICPRNSAGRWRICLRNHHNGWRLSLYPRSQSHTV